MLRTLSRIPEQNHAPRASYYPRQVGANKAWLPLLYASTARKTYTNGTVCIQLYAPLLKPRALSDQYQRPWE